jgi:endogenous inhibitor of DNA gyrase (YacG/DUF329 family)
MIEMMEQPKELVGTIECPYCQENIPRPSKALTVTCDNCGKSVALDNKVLNNRYVFQGEILTRGTIFIGPKGWVKANVSATEVIVEGVLEGSVKAVEKLIVAKTGSFLGHATAKKLIIADGATIQGSFKIGQPKTHDSLDCC